MELPTPTPPEIGAAIQMVTGGGQTWMEWLKTTNGLATAALATAAVGYCVYFDHKRRSAPDFREKFVAKRVDAKMAEMRAEAAMMEAKMKQQAQMQAMQGAMGGAPPGMGMGPPGPGGGQITAQDIATSLEASTRKGLLAAKTATTPEEEKEAIKWFVNAVMGAELLESTMPGQQLIRGIVEKFKKELIAMEKGHIFNQFVAELQSGTQKNFIVVPPGK